MSAGFARNQATGQASSRAEPERDAAGMRVQPLGLGQRHRGRADARAARPRPASTQVVRLRKSNTERPEAKRAVRPVGSTWFGPGHVVADRLGAERAEEGGAGVADAGEQRRGARAP